VRVFDEITGDIGFVTVAVAVGFAVGTAFDDGVGVSLTETVGVGDGETDVTGSPRTTSSREVGFSKNVGGDPTSTKAVPVAKPSSERTRYLIITPPQSEPKAKASW